MYTEKKVFLIKSIKIFMINFVRLIFKILKYALRKKLYSCAKKRAFFAKLEQTNFL